MQFCKRSSISTCKRISNEFLPQTSLDILAVNKREKRRRHACTKNAVTLALEAPTIPRGGSSYYPDDDSDNDDRYYSSSSKRASDNAYYGDQNREDDSWVYQNRGDGDSYYNNRANDNNPYYSDEQDKYYGRQDQQSSSSSDRRYYDESPHADTGGGRYYDKNDKEEQDYYNRDMRQRPREDYTRRDDYSGSERSSSTRSKSSGKSKVSLEGIPGYSVVSKGNRRIGTMIVGGGLVVTMLGISLFFNKTLMRLGNLLLVVGVPILIGPGRTAGYFLQPTKFRATGCLMVGIFLVFVGWPIFGIALEIFGLLNLFGNMFPLLKVILKQMPFVGDLFSNNNKSSSSPPKRKRSRYDDDAGYGDGGGGEERYY